MSGRRHASGIYLVLGLAVLLWALQHRTDEPLLVAIGAGGEQGEPDRLAFSPSDRPELRPLEEANAALDAYWRGAYARAFPDARNAYRPPRLSLYDPPPPTGAPNDVATFTAFYAPWGDSRVQGDGNEISFNIDALDEADAFVVAHEYGHHVQYLSGAWDAFDLGPTAVGSPRQQALDALIELQAECLSGVWAAASVRAGGLVSEQDVRREEVTLRFGGDTITHGAGRDRAAWFRHGFERGAAACLAILDHLDAPGPPPA